MSVMLNMRKQHIVPIKQEFTPKGLVGYVHADLGGQGWLDLGANATYHQYRIVLEGNWTFSAHPLSDQTCLFLAAFASNKIHWKHKRENYCWSSAEQAQCYLSSSSVCPNAQWKEAGRGPGPGKELGALSSDNKLSKLQTTNCFSSEYPWRTHCWFQCLRVKMRKYREVVKMSSQTMRDDCAMSTVEHWAKNTWKNLKFQSLEVLVILISFKRSKNPSYFLFQNFCLFT